MGRGEKHSGRKRKYRLREGRVALRDKERGRSIGTTRPQTRVTALELLIQKVCVSGVVTVMILTSPGPITSRTAIVKDGWQIALLSPVLQFLLVIELACLFLLSWSSPLLLLEEAEYISAAIGLSQCNLLWPMKC